MSIGGGTPSGVGRRFAALGGGEALARLAAFVATIYLARTLSPAMYGVVGVAMGVMLYLIQITDGGIELMGMPVVARARDRVTEIAPPILSVRFAASATVTLIVFIVGLTLLPQPDGAILAASSLVLLATGLSTRWIHLGLERSRWVAIARTAGELVTLGAVLVLVRDAGDAIRVPLAQFLGAVVTSLALLAALSRAGIRLAWRWAPAEARPVFARSRYLVLFTLLGLLLFNFDLIYLRVRSGAETAGYYASAYTVIAFAANLIVAFAQTVLPTLARLEHDRPARDSLYQGASVHALAVALPLGAGAWYVSPQLVELMFGPAYLPAVVALQWLAWTIPLAALREMPVAALIAAGRERSLLRINALTAAANVPLVLAAVPRYGLVGAAAATCATELIRYALATRAAQAAGFPAAAGRRLLRPALATAAMASVLTMLAPAQLWVSVPVGVLTYAAALAVLGAVRRDDAGRMRISL